MNQFKVLALALLLLFSSSLFSAKKNHSKRSHDKSDTATSKKRKKRSRKVPREIFTIKMDDGSWTSGRECRYGCGEFSFYILQSKMKKKPFCEEYRRMIRRINAHESQRCPNNLDATRVPRKGSKRKSKKNSEIQDILEKLSKSGDLGKLSKPGVVGYLSKSGDLEISASPCVSEDSASSNALGNSESPGALGVLAKPKRPPRLNLKGIFPSTETLPRGVSQVNKSSNRHFVYKQPGDPDFAPGYGGSCASAFRGVVNLATANATALPPFPTATATALPLSPSLTSSKGPDLSPASRAALDHLLSGKIDFPSPRDSSFELSPGFGSPPPIACNGNHKDCLCHSCFSASL